MPASMGTNPIWYTLAEEILKRQARPRPRHERLAFIEGAVAAFEMANEHEMLVDLNREVVEALSAVEPPSQ